MEEKDRSGTATILRYESLSEILTERKNFLISKHRVMYVTSRSEKDGSETWNYTGSRFGDSVEAKSRFCPHGGVRRHSYFGRGAGG